MWCSCSAYRFRVCPRATAPDAAFPLAFSQNYGFDSAGLVLRLQKAKQQTQMQTKALHKAELHLDAANLANRCHAPAFCAAFVRARADHSSISCVQDID